MGTKGVPFGYLEFSRAIGEIMPTRARRRRPPGLGRARPRIQPGPVRFEPAHTGLVKLLEGTAEPQQRFLSETNSCNGSDRTVATARTLNDRYALQTVPRSAINSAPHRGLQTHSEQFFSPSFYTEDEI